jgi:hypothetical protein
MMYLKSFIVALKAAMFGTKAGRFVGRARVADVVSYPYTGFTYRMGAGFPGAVNRSHPASIEPTVNDATNPITAAGLPGVISVGSNTVRALISTDTAVTTIYGVAVRAFPIQASSGGAYGSSSFGVSTMPVGQPMDILRSGYIMAQLNPAAGAVTKGSPVFVWVAASTGGHVQNGFETVASAGNTAALDPTRYFYNGPADSSGVVEVEVNV